MVLTMRRLLAVACVASGVFETAAEDRTITKVVKLLQEMLDKSKEDGEKDTNLFAKYKCYCDINAADKTKSIADSGKSIELLTAQIGELSSQNAKLSVEHSELQMQMADNERARATAESLRAKAKEDFQSEETDMENAIGQMGQAIDTLAAIGADQSAAASLASVHQKFMPKGGKATLSSDVRGALKVASVFLPPKSRSAIASFLQGEPEKDEKE